MSGGTECVKTMRPGTRARRQNAVTADENRTERTACCLLLDRAALVARRCALAGVWKMPRLFEGMVVRTGRKNCAAES
jgi:hypothetical protein